MMSCRGTAGAKSAFRRSGQCLKRMHVDAGHLLYLHHVASYLRETCNSLARRPFPVSQLYGKWQGHARCSLIRSHLARMLEDQGCKTHDAAVGGGVTLPEVGVLGYTLLRKDKAAPKLQLRLHSDSAC